MAKFARCITRIALLQFDHHDAENIEIPSLLAPNGVSVAMRLELMLQAVKIPTSFGLTPDFSIAFRCISTTLSLPQLPVDHLQEPLRLKSLMPLRLVVVVAGFVGKLQSTCIHVVLAAVPPSVNRKQSFCNNICNPYASLPNDIF